MCYATALYWYWSHANFKRNEFEDRNNMADILVKYDQHFLSQKQEFFKRFQFNRRNQESGESIDEYVSVLRNLAKTCGFCDCMRELLLVDCLLLGISFHFAVARNIVLKSNTGEKTWQVESVEHIEQYDIKFVETSHYLKRCGRKGFVESLFFRS